MQLQQIRNFMGCRVYRDRKRRRWAKEYAEERLRLLALKRNNILPIEINVSDVITLPYI